MILSLIKILVFVAAVGGLTWGATRLMQVEGSAIINVAGYEITLNVLQLVVGALAVILLVWLTIKLIGLLISVLKFLNGDDTAISRYFSRNRERRGLKALTNGMVALAAGDGAEAMAQARKADKLLHQPKLTSLLAAQSAELVGDKRGAETAYKKLLSDEQTRFVGVRGLMKQKLADGDTETAMQLAEKAFALKPRHRETQDVLLKLQAEKGDWDGARSTLNAKLKSGAIPRDVHRRRDAVLALSEMRTLLEADSTADISEAAIEANRLSPDLVPAAVLAAHTHIDKGEAKFAARVLKKAWEAQPHPDLAAAFAAIAPEETPEARIKRFRALTRVHPKDAETRMLLAELHIANEDFPEARRALGDLVETAPTARSLTIMAAIERGEGADDSVVRGWLTKALIAPRGPQWVCSACNHVHRDWAPICDSCGAFDTLVWKTPESQEVAMPASTEMLPLLTTAKDEDAPAVENAVVVVDHAPEDSSEDAPDMPDAQDSTEKS